MNDQKRPQILRDICKQTGITYAMLAEFFNMSLNDVHRMVEEQSTIGTFSKLLRALDVKIVIPNASEKRISFPVGALVRQFQSNVWRARHDMIKWPKDITTLRKIIVARLQLQTAKSLAADLTSHGVPGPERWDLNAIQRASDGRGITMEARLTPIQMAKSVLVREITAAFNSPKFFSYVDLVTDKDPMILIIKPCPRFIQQKLIQAALLIEGFIESSIDAQGNVGNADAQPVDQNG